MAAIVTVTTTSPEAWATFIEVVQGPSITATELGMNSGIYQVVFSSAGVEMGHGFETLQKLMEEETSGSSAGLERANFG